jgi:hypothetical protein
MDFKRLAVGLLQRLAPIYIAVALSCIHDVMASIRYDAVAAKLLALVPEQDVPLMHPHGQP